MPLVSNQTARLKQNYHHTFELKENGITIVRHTLLLNPQNFSQNEQARVNVTQTLGGAYVVDYGSGLKQVTISGNTGYRSRYNADREVRDGWEEFKHFRNEIYRKFIATNNPDYELYWYNWEDEEYYIIQPTAFRLQRSVSEPLLYRYELSFTCLAPAMQATKPVDDMTGVDFNALLSRMSKAVSAVNEMIAKLNGTVKV